MHLINFKKKTSIKDIQIEFNHTYPYLWIEFYYKSSSDLNLLFVKNKINAEKKVLNLCTSSTLKYLNISENSTVGELKKEIATKMGLTGQLLRKAGSLWITTSLTEDWSLLQQNYEGAQMEAKNSIY